MSCYMSTARNFAISSVPRFEIRRVVVGYVAAAGFGRRKVVRTETLHFPWLRSPVFPRGRGAPHPQLIDGATPQACFLPAQ